MKGSICTWSSSRAIESSISAENMYVERVKDSSSTHVEPCSRRRALHSKAEQKTTSEIETVESKDGKLRRMTEKSNTKSEQV